MTRNMTRSSTAAAAVAVALLLGCSNHEQGANQPAAAETAAPGPVRHSYTVRGVVVTIPSADRPLDDLEIKHEPIPDYKNRDGEVYVNSRGVRGMVAMTMGFPLAEGVSLGDITPGDKVRFVFVTTWGEAYPSYEVTEIEKLPADTELNFGG